MKTSDEIRMVHDMLEHLIRGEKPFQQANQGLQSDAIAFKHALCWTLEDPNADKFQRFMDRLDERARAAGYRLTGPAAEEGGGT